MTDREQERLNERMRPVIEPRSWMYGRSEFASQPAKDSERARIGDFSRLKPDEPTEAHRRELIRSWIDVMSENPSDRSCDKCETRIVAYSKTEPYWLERAELFKSGWLMDSNFDVHENDTYLFRRCSVCAATPYNYLTKFDRNWLVGVMLDHFGGDLSRVPTLDELKALL